MSTLWTEGIICAFERKDIGTSQMKWIAIGWRRINDLVKTLKVDEGTPVDSNERPANSLWWCLFIESHAYVQLWMRNQRIRPPFGRYGSLPLSNGMKYLKYELPLRKSDVLAFELPGLAYGNQEVEGCYVPIPIAVRSWQSRYFLVSFAHAEGYDPNNFNILGIKDVQEHMLGVGFNRPETLEDVVAQLATCLARWEDRIFRKEITGGADQVEVIFMNARNRENFDIHGDDLNQRVKSLSRKAIQAKWSLHARDEIMFELLCHLTGPVARTLLVEIRKGTSDMVEEQEVVHGRLLSLQDKIQSTNREYIEAKSLTVTHNIAVYGGFALPLSIIATLMGSSLDGIPGRKDTPYAFPVFVACLTLIGIILVVVGNYAYGLKRPRRDKEALRIGSLELGELVKPFQHLWHINRI